MGSYEKGSFKRKSAIDLNKAVLFRVSYRIKTLKRGIVYGPTTACIASLAYMTPFLCLEETKYYKTVTRNVTHFDNGPRIIRHPPPSVNLGNDLGLNVSWTCDAVGKNPIEYKWLKDDQVIWRLCC